MLVGDADKEIAGNAEGRIVGTSLSTVDEVVGKEEGTDEEIGVGASVGTATDTTVGIADGTVVGLKIGTEVGVELGFTVGLTLGVVDGIDVGIPEG